MDLMTIILGLMALFVGIGILKGLIKGIFKLAFVVLVGSIILKMVL